MDIESISISPIITKNMTKSQQNHCTVCWIKDGVHGLEINGALFQNVENSIFFLDSTYDWKVYTDSRDTSFSGYILSIPRDILNNPLFQELHINEVRILNNNAIPKINMSPGIEVRVKAILEMLDELLSTRLKHREQAILSLLCTFFIYCDGKCNIKSNISDNNAKTLLVYRYKKLINRNFKDCHRVSDYADMLQVSGKYLNQCVKEILDVTAKNLIDEQLVMRARHDLKFTSKSIKEICYDLGFSSADYFSYFFKRVTNQTPTEVRIE